ncbi:GNAT family N-acetyltransferase [Cellulomonas sp. NPDC089187]|uniref:GNAT family N-acetyltransferase n=1 Tax=Cellulomonas sp. NPDC089187 TaxID=3154970 RepID=UPI0034437B10
MTASGAGDLTVRLFRDDDAVPLTAMLHRAYADLAATGLNYTAATQDVMTTRHRADGGRCWVVEDDGALVATLTVSVPPGRGIRALTPVAREPRRAWLNQLAVAPEHRGQGLARSLWSGALAWARDEQITAIGADTALSADRLVGMYGRWGFEHVDTVHWAGKTYDSAVLLHQLI